MSGTTAGSDPFGLTPNTRAYVPRAATERALAELVAGVQTAEAPIALLGPAGAGKTLLLHLLAERVAPALRSVYLPNPRLGPEEICTWIAASLGAPAGEEAIPVFRAWLEHLRAKEQACLLLIDDVDAMPEETARWLGRLVAETRGALRLAMAALEGPATPRFLRAFGEVRCIALDAAMSPDDTAEYVGWRLRQADVPDAVRARFDPSSIEALHHIAQGNPRRLHLAVEAFARSGNIAVLEDEIAAFAEPPTPAVPPIPSVVAVHDAGEPTDAAPPPADDEPEEGAPPRRSLLGAVFVVATALLAVALLLDRDPPEDALAAPARARPQLAPAADPTGGAAPSAAPPADALAVNVNASPWARVEIDGVDVGETPLAGIPLRPGPHAFRAELPDGRIVERTVEIDADHRHVAFD
jgi:MSHA biogenesis protein MshM